MIKFLPIDFLGVSHRNPGENNNAVNCLQISAAIVPELFQFPVLSKTCILMS